MEPGSLDYRDHITQVRPKGMWHILYMLSTPDQSDERSTFLMIKHDVSDDSDRSGGMWCWECEGGCWRHLAAESLKPEVNIPPFHRGRTILLLDLRMTVIIFELFTGWRSQKRVEWPGTSTSTIEYSSQRKLQITTHCWLIYTFKVIHI